jgi:hypothetical protein
MLAQGSRSAYTLLYTATGASMKIVGTRSLTRFPSLRAWVRYWSGGSVTLAACSG